MTIKKDGNIQILVNLLSQYRELNVLYRSIVDNSILRFYEQCRIVDFYNEFGDTASLDRAILNLIFTVDKDKQVFVIDNTRAEIDSNIALYLDNQDFLNSINTKSIYADRRNPIQEQIERQLDRTQELWKKLKQVRGSLEAQSWQNNNQAVEKLSMDESFYEKLYKDEQEKLDNLYTQKKKSDAETSKYRENIFYKINDLNNSFLSIIENYFPIEKESEKEVLVAPQIRKAENRKSLKVNHFRGFLFSAESTKWGEKEHIWWRNR